MRRPTYGYDNNHHDDKCIDDKKHCSCQKCCDDRKHDDKKDCKVGVTAVAVDEKNNNPTPQPPTTGNGTNGTTLRRIADVEIKVDEKCCDEVLLNAAINWTPPTIPRMLLEPDLIDLLAFPVRFTIWRGDPFDGRRTKAICSFIDSSPLALATAGQSTPAEFATVTTDFKCVDDRPHSGCVEYVLTLDFDPGLLPPGLDLSTNGSLEDLLALVAGGNGFRVTASTLAAFCINEDKEKCNKKDNCDCCR